jgi:signal peptidase II
MERTLKAERSFRGLLWGLALFGLILDQSTKYGVFKWLHDSPSEHRIFNSQGAVQQGEHVVIPGAFKLLAQFDLDKEQGTGVLANLRTLFLNTSPKVNQGALFGLGGEYAALANAMFAGVSILAAVAIVYWSSRRTTARDWALCAALGLILAGTLGNLYDRIVFNGVRDFLYFHLIEWPVFNVADCCLVCGAFLLLAQAFLGHSARTDALTASAASGATSATSGASSMASGANSLASGANSVANGASSVASGASHRPGNPALTAMIGSDD